jgi:hypothetical protein
MHLENKVAIVDGDAELLEISDEAFDHNSSRQT